MMTSSRAQVSSWMEQELTERLSSRCSTSLMDFQSSDPSGFWGSGEERVTSSVITLLHGAIWGTPDEDEEEQVEEVME